jgi:hypothetical protein
VVQPVSCNAPMATAVVLKLERSKRLFMVFSQ